MCGRRLEHVEDFEMMSETASEDQIKTWTAMADNADNTRLADVSVMDIYNIALPTGMCTHYSHRKQNSLRQ